MAAATRKGFKKPWGNRARARSSISPASKPVRHACARVVVRCAFREGAARRVAVQPSRLQVADDDPFAGEIDAPEQTAARKQRAASCGIGGELGGLGGRNTVERLVRFRICPGRLDEYGGGDRAAPENDRSKAQIGLRAPIAVDEVATARKQRDRYRAEFLVPFDMQADRSARVDVRDVVGPEEIGFAREAASFVGELRPDIEAARELRSGAALEYPLGGAREPGPSVVPHRRDQIGSLRGRAVVRGARAHAGTYPRVFRQGGLGEGRKWNDQQKSERHASRSHAESVPRGVRPSNSGAIR